MKNKKERRNVFFHTVLVKFSHSLSKIRNEIHVVCLLRRSSNSAGVFYAFWSHHSDILLCIMYIRIVTRKHNVYESYKHTQHYSYHSIISLYFVLWRDTFICFPPYNKYNTCFICARVVCQKQLRAPICNNFLFSLFICIAAKSNIDNKWIWFNQI